jgi:alpha-1,6-mannosyltransferase
VTVRVNGGDRHLGSVVSACGLINLLVLAMLVPISYALAVVVPHGESQPNELAILAPAIRSVETLIPAAAGVLKKYLSEDSPLATSAAARILSFAVPIFILTVTSLLAIIKIRRNFDSIDEHLVSLLFRFSLGFAAVSFFAYPIFTQDFWWYVSRARMLQDGRNPYYQIFGNEHRAGIPIDDPSLLLMPYGPLWAVLATGLASLARRNLVLEFVLFKLTLTVSWAMSLLLIRKILGGFSPGRRAMAMCVFGWLPASTHLSIAEGHNDVVMVFFLLLWMYLIVQNQHALSPLALASSALIKYATAPLVGLELIHAWSSSTLSRRRYLVTLFGSTLFVGVVFFLFWRGSGFFVGVTQVRGERIHSPAHTIYALALRFKAGVPWWLALNLVRAGFLAVVLWYAVRYRRKPDFLHFAALTLAVLCMVLFSAGYVWPWYFIWILAPAAIAAHSGLLRFVLPVTILSPLLSLPGLMDVSRASMVRSGIVFYGLVCLGMLLMPRGGLIPTATSADPASP